MELGAFSVVEPHGTGATSERYDELLRLAESAERAGLASFWVGEHHFQESGVCPSPPVFLAAAGQRTSVLRLGSMVCVLPFHGAVDVAEQYSLLDLLLHGRLELGVGSGYVPLELEAFGVAPAAKRARFDRGLDELCAALDGQPVRIGTGPAVRLNVRSPQVPRPPIWVAAQRRESFSAIARRGLSLALAPYAAFRDRSELREGIREYRSALPPGVPGRVAAAVPIYVGDDRPCAWRALEQHLRTRLEALAGYFEGGACRPSPSVSARAVEATGFALLGSVDDVAEGMAHLARAGVDELLGMFDFGGLSAPQAVLSLRRAALAHRGLGVGGVGLVPPRGALAFQ